jgi:hypothetical protein
LLSYAFVSRAKRNEHVYSYKIGPAVSIKLSRGAQVENQDGLTAKAPRKNEERRLET